MLVILVDGSIWQNPRNKKVLIASNSLKLEVKLYYFSNNLHRKSDLVFLSSCSETVESFDLSPINLFSKLFTSVFAKLCNFSFVPAWLLVHLRFLRNLYVYRVFIWNLFFGGFTAVWASSSQALGLLRQLQYLLNRLNVTIIYDFQDVLSDDTSSLSLSNSLRRVLAGDEKWIMQAANTLLFASRAMKDYLRHSFGFNCSRHQPMHVVYNSFSDSFDPSLSLYCDFKPPVLDDHSLSVVWFSQTVGIDRGLSLFFEACEVTQFPVEFHIYGYESPPVRQWLSNWQIRCPSLKLVSMGIVSHQQLAASLPFYDVGLSLESVDISNRNLTITNKVLMYLQSGIFAICTPTIGHQELLDEFPDQMQLCDTSREMHSCLRSAYLGRYCISLRREFFVNRFNSSSFGWDAQVSKYHQILRGLFSSSIPSLTSRSC